MILGFFAYLIVYYLFVPIDSYSFPLYFDFSAYPEAPPTAWIILSPSHLSDTQRQSFLGDVYLDRYGGNGPHWQYSLERFISTETELVRNAITSAYQVHMTSPLTAAAGGGGHHVNAQGAPEDDNDVSTSVLKSTPQISKYSLFPKTSLSDAIDNHIEKTYRSPESLQSPSKDIFRGYSTAAPSETTEGTSYKPTSASLAPMPRSILSSNTRYDYMLELTVPRYSSIPDKLHPTLVVTNLEIYHCDIAQYKRRQVMDASTLLRAKHVKARLDEIKLLHNHGFHYNQEEYRELQDIYDRLMEVHDFQKAHPMQRHPFHLSDEWQLIASTSLAYRPFSNVYEHHHGYPSSSPTTLQWLSSSLNQSPSSSSPRQYDYLRNVNQSFLSYHFLRIVYGIMSWIPHIQLFVASLDYIGRLFYEIILWIPRFCGFYDISTTHTLLMMQDYTEIHSMPSHAVKITLDTIDRRHVTKAFEASLTAAAAAASSTSMSMSEIPGASGLTYISHGYLHIVVQLTGIYWYMYHQFYASVVVGTFLLGVAIFIWLLFCMGCGGITWFIFGDHSSDSAGQRYASTYGGATPAVSASSRPSLSPNSSVGALSYSSSSSYPQYVPLDQSYTQYLRSSSPHFSFPSHSPVISSQSSLLVPSLSLSPSSTHSDFTPFTRQSTQPSDHNSSRSAGPSQPLQSPVHPHGNQPRRSSSPTCSNHTEPETSRSSASSLSMSASPGSQTQEVPEFDWESLSCSQEPSEENPEIPSSRSVMMGSSSGHEDEAESISDSQALQQITQRASQQPFIHADE